MTACLAGGGLCMGQWIRWGGIWNLSPCHCLHCLPPCNATTHSSLPHHLPPSPPATAFSFYLVLPLYLVPVSHSHSSALLSPSHATHLLLTASLSVNMTWHGMLCSAWFQCHNIYKNKQKNRNWSGDGRTDEQEQEQ